MLKLANQVCTDSVPVNLILHVSVLIYLVQRMSLLANLVIDEFVFVDLTSLGVPTNLVLAEPLWASLRSCDLVQLDMWTNLVLCEVLSDRRQVNAVIAENFLLAC